MAGQKGCRSGGTPSSFLACNHFATRLGAWPYRSACTADTSALVTRKAELVLRARPSSPGGQKFKNLEIRGHNWRCADTYLVNGTVSVTGQWRHKAGHVTDPWPGEWLITGGQGRKGSPHLTPYTRLRT
jgi:hypothetical protein